jgi:hypothetical protein
MLKGVWVFGAKGVLVILSFQREILYIPQQIITQTFKA